MLSEVWALRITLLVIILVGILTVQMQPSQTVTTDVCELSSLSAQLKWSTGQCGRIPTSHLLSISN